MRMAPAPDVAPESLWVATDTGWRVANATQRAIWCGLRTLLGADFGTSHAYDGHTFQRGQAVYQYALCTGSHGGVHFINSLVGGPWREIGPVPSNALLCMATLDDHAFAEMRRQWGADMNPGWAGSPMHTLE
jgi:hypothetical protein